MSKRFNRDVAISIANDFQFPLDVEFHTLSTMQVLGVVDAANYYRYRAPKNANGSRARYFHAYLKRSAKL